MPTETSAVETGRPTYSAGVISLTPSFAGAGDILQIQGAPGIVVKILKVKLTGQSTAAASIPVTLVRRSAANTSGTPTVLNGLNREYVASNLALNSSPKAVLTTYGGATAPTNSGVIGNIAADRLQTTTTAGGANLTPVMFDWTDAALVKMPIVKGSSDFVALQLGAAVPAGFSGELTVLWTEEFGVV